MTDPWDWYMNTYMFPIIYHKNQPNVRKYIIHGLYGCINLAGYDDVDDDVVDDDDDAVDAVDGDDLILKDMFGIKKGYFWDLFVSV